MAGFAAVVWPMLRGQQAMADQTFAAVHLHDLYRELRDFERDYGRFPDASTISAVRAATSTTLALGDRTSNELFRQLIATGVTSEQIFWSKTPGSHRPPDDILGKDALAKGECSFTYITGRSTKDDPRMPIAMNPMIPGTWRFDPKPFRRRATVLRIDGSATSSDLEENGHIMSKDKDLFDPSQPFWGGKAPDIKWPE
jgi:hypothetical protein